MVARRIHVRPAVLDHLTGTIGATAKLPPARGRSGSNADIACQFESELMQIKAIIFTVICRAT